MTAQLRTIGLVMVGAATALTLFGAPAAQAVEPITVNPAGLPRGADVRVPHIESGVLIDGKTRIKVTPTASLIDTTPSGYIVLDYANNASRLLKVTPTKQTVLISGDWIDAAHVSGDKKQVVTSGTGSNRTTVRVLDIASGAQTAGRAFQGYRTVVGIQGVSVFLSGTNSGTVRWYYTTDKQTKNSDLRAYTADLAHGLLAGYDSDYCSVLWRVSAPGQVLSRLCGHFIQAFNSTGTAVATLNSNGDQASLRGLGGRATATFAVQNGWIASVLFESTGTLLMWAQGTEYSAWVRGWRSGANRASVLQPR